MRPARLLVPFVAVVLVLAGCTAAPSGPGVSRPDGGLAGGSSSETAPSDGAPSEDAPSDGTAGDGTAGDEPTLTVRTTDGSWSVRGTGFEGGNQYLVQCAEGAAAGSNALDECDMSTSEQVVADDSGHIAATRQLKAFVNVGSVSEVDCTTERCVLAVADLSDRVLASDDAQLPDDTEPPDAPTLTLTETSFHGDKGRVTVTGEGFAAGGTVRIVQCATTSDGGVDADNCLYDEGKRLVADSSGTILTKLPVQREIERIGGGAADCTDAGACLVANAWTDGSRMARTDLLWK